MWIYAAAALDLATSRLRRAFSRPLARFRPAPRAPLQLAAPGDPDWPTDLPKDWNGPLRACLKDASIVLIANREPYIHQRKENGELVVIRPASGLVSALEPVLRVSGGLWIAHGSGSADFEMTDALDELRVPPDHPSYKLRRIRLTSDEEAGYYFGFANEGLWPLCHLAHTRPAFRLSDWNHYQTVNRRFADAVPESSLGEGSLVLVQDYHFALVPRLLRERLRSRGPASANVGLFWHIPWPNPAAFGICPWPVELLRGLLGADVIGFHTQYDCNNFLETCNRLLEARVDSERFSVTMDGHETRVRAFPIGIDVPPVRALTEAERQSMKASYGITAPLVAVGVDRLDYTKGLVERIDAVERFLEKHPTYVGRFSLAQLGSPSRTVIPAYQRLVEQVEAAAARVNARFGSGDYRPVILISRHHEWSELQYFYQLGDLCLVTSLHDGMNLVAKEYVWCKPLERPGALVLSRFTGASRELTESWLVNPYSTEEVADAIAGALEASDEERGRRMSAMRAKVEARTAYHWAADLITAIRTPLPPRPEAIPPQARTRRRAPENAALRAGDWDPTDRSRSAAWRAR
jgi:trehalose 6-phosphate synthase